MKEYEDKSYLKNKLLSKKAKHFWKNGMNRYNLRQKDERNMIMIDKSKKRI